MSFIELALPKKFYKLLVINVRLGVPYHITGHNILGHSFKVKAPITTMALWHRHLRI